MTESKKIRFLLIKTLLPVILIAGVVVFIFSTVKIKTAHTPHSEISSLEVGNTVPDFDLYRFDEKTFKLSSFKSKIIFINFWASWCEACIAEIPSILSLKSRFKTEELEIIFLNVDENPKAAIPRVTQNLKIPFPVYVDRDQKLSTLFEVYGIPFTVIINQNRKILLKDVGDRNWDTEELQTQFREWIQAQASS